MDVALIGRNARSRVEGSGKSRLCFSTRGYLGTMFGGTLLRSAHPPLSPLLSDQERKQIKQFLGCLLSVPKTVHVEHQLVLA
jgi:hypothetical protein